MGEMFLIILPLIFLTLGAAAFVIFLLNFTSPQNPDGSLVTINLAYFFVSLFISLAGFVTLVLYWVGNLQGRASRQGSIEAVHKPKLLLRKSLRHGLLIASGIVGIGILNASNLSNPFNIILLISAVILIEVYWIGH